MVAEATREVSHQMHPLFQYLGLEQTLRRLCPQGADRCSITINFSSENVPSGLSFET